MANRSSLPPNQDQKKFVQDEEVGRGTKHNQKDKEEKGYQEDQPGHPVRTTGSTRPDQESYLSNGAKSPNEDHPGQPERLNFFINKTNVMANDKNIGQQSNENWDDQNDQRSNSSKPGQPNPERYADANLGQGSGSLGGQNERFEEAEREEKNEKHHGSAFNEDQEGPAVGAGSSQRGEHRHAGPLDADLEPLPSEKRSGNV